MSSMDNGFFLEEEDDDFFSEEEEVVGGDGCCRTLIPGEHPSEQDEAVDAPSSVC